ncbi:unnamed protein product, partial [Didymodactylos carnosus]
SEEHKIPTTIPIIDEILTHLQKPNDIRLPHNLADFIDQVFEWIQWFDGFISTFQPIIAWLKIYEVVDMDFLLISLKELEENDMELVFVKSLVKNLLDKLIPLSSHLQRLCRLLSCPTSFTITNQDAINLNRNAQEFIREIKQSSSVNTFEVGQKSIGEKLIKISGRQLIQWSLACKNYPCIISCFDEHYNEPRQITTKDVASLLSKGVFKFIDKLLIGDVSLTEMLNSKTTFSNDSIDIKDEVTKLYLSQGSDSKNLKRQIEKICEWLQIYQYFSFISTIIDCIKSFEIIDDNNQSITQLEILSNIEDKHLKHISESNETSKIIFNGLDNRHLQLNKK